MPLTVRLIALVLLIAANPGLARTPDSPAPGSTAADSDPEAVVPGQPIAKPKPMRNPAFYSAEVTLTSQSDAERRGATMRALGQVVVRLTGNPQAAGNALVRRASSNIEALVTASEVRQDSSTVNGVPTFKTTLAVSFDPESVDALIAGAGLKYWTGTRPKPILWLAIDDGSGARLVTGQKTNVVKPLATRGLERGMRYLLPAGTATEQAAVPAIWSLNASALQVLTNRYQNDTQLIGKIYRQPPGWAADWLLTQGGVELARWSFSDADARRVIASGVDDGANAIAKRDGVYLDTGGSGVFSVDIAGVQNQADYLRLMSYLETMAVVRKVTAVEARPEHLRLQMDLSVGMKGFRTMIATGTTLQPASDAGASSGGVPRFVLQ